MSSHGIEKASGGTLKVEDTAVESTITASVSDAIDNSQDSIIIHDAPDESILQPTSAPASTSPVRASSSIVLCAPDTPASAAPDDCSFEVLGTPSSPQWYTSSASSSRVVSGASSIGTHTSVTSISSAEHDSVGPKISEEAYVRVKSDLSPIPDQETPSEGEAAAALNPEAVVFESTEHFKIPFELIISDGKTALGDLTKQARSELAKMGLGTIPSMHGPLSLPYARCPSGIDAFVFSVEKEEDPYTFILDTERNPNTTRVGAQQFRINQVPLPGNSRYSQPAHLVSSRRGGRVVSTPLASVPDPAISATRPQVTASRAGPTHLDQTSSRPRVTSRSNQTQGMDSSSRARNAAHRAPSASELPQTQHQQPNTHPQPMSHDEVAAFIANSHRYGSQTASSAAPSISSAPAYTGNYARPPLATMPPSPWGLNPYWPPAPPPPSFDYYMNTYAHLQSPYSHVPLGYGPHGPTSMPLTHAAVLGYGQQQAQPMQPSREQLESLETTLAHAEYVAHATALELEQIAQQPTSFFEQPVDFLPVDLHAASHESQQNVASRISQTLPADTTRHRRKSTHVALAAKAPAPAMHSHNHLGLGQASVTNMQRRRSAAPVMPQIGTRKMSLAPAVTVGPRRSSVAPQTRLVKDSNLTQTSAFDPSSGVMPSVSLAPDPDDFGIPASKHQRSYSHLGKQRSTHIVQVLGQSNIPAQHASNSRAASRHASVAVTASGWGGRGSGHRHVFCSAHNLSRSSSGAACQAAADYLNRRYELE